MGFEPGYNERNVGEPTSYERRMLELSLAHEMAPPRAGAGPKYRVKCCGSIIQSLHQHDYVSCQCGKSAIDGGDAYTRCAGNPLDFEEVRDADPAGE